MKSCYIIKVDSTSIAIADLCDYFGDGFIITRINVPIEYRGKGFGSQLLNLILTEADKTNTTLFLEILSSGALSYSDLEKWYKRHGFKDWCGILRRKPNKEKIQ